jgi:hypothetical protein
MAVFWDIAPFSMVVLNGHPDDGDIKLLQKVGQYLPDCTVQRPGRRPSPQKAQSL